MNRFFSSSSLLSRTYRNVDDWMKRKYAWMLEPNSKIAQKKNKSRTIFSTLIYARQRTTDEIHMTFNSRFVLVFFCLAVCSLRFDHIIQQRRKIQLTRTMREKRTPHTFNRRNVAENKWWIYTLYLHSMFFPQMHDIWLNCGIWRLMDFLKIQNLTHIHLLIFLQNDGWKTDRSLQFIKNVR